MHQCVHTHTLLILGGANFQSSSHFCPGCKQEQKCLPWGLDNIRQGWSPTVYVVVECFFFVWFFRGQKYLNNTFGIWFTQFFVINAKITIIEENVKNINSVSKSVIDMLKKKSVFFSYYGEILSFLGFLLRFCQNARRGIKAGNRTSVWTLFRDYLCSYMLTTWYYINLHVHLLLDGFHECNHNVAFESTLLHLLRLLSADDVRRTLHIINTTKYAT